MLTKRNENFNKMKKIKNIFLILFTFTFLFNCEENYEPEPLDYVTFETDFDKGVDAALTTAVEVKVYAGTISSSERVFTITVDADKTSLDTAGYTVPSSVTIPANSNVGSFEVTINGPGVGDGGNLVLSFVSGDSAYTGESISINIFPVCFANSNNLTLILDITFDSWPDEIYWVLEDSSGATVAASATPPAWGAYAGLSGSISQKFCLPDGTYTFTILDAYQDGAGPYKLSFDDGTVIHSSNGGYGAGETFDFDI